MAARKDEKEGNNKNCATKMDSCDTLADVDMNFKDMRTCDGPCKALTFSDQLELFECCHAVCGECLNQLTDIEVQTGKFLCPLSTCRHGNAERNVSSVKEYNFLKQNFLRSHKIDYPAAAAAAASFSKLTNSSAEASISMMDILQFDRQNNQQKQQQHLQTASPSTTKEGGGGNDEYGKKEEESDNIKIESSKIISGTTLISTTKLSNQESCTSVTTTSPDFYDDEEESGPSTNPLVAVTDNNSSTTHTNATKKPSAYPINASEYDENLIAELQALTCSTAKSCFYEEDFDDCTTAQTFSKYD